MKPWPRPSFSPVALGVEFLAGVAQLDPVAEADRGAVGAELIVRQLDVGGVDIAADPVAGLVAGDQRPGRDAAAGRALDLLTPRVSSSLPPSRSSSAWPRAAHSQKAGAQERRAAVYAWKSPHSPSAFADCLSGSLPLNSLYYVQRTVYPGAYAPFHPQTARRRPGRDPAIAGSAAAADLTVTVKGDDGAPLADAVVMVHPAGGSARPAPSTTAGP